MLKNTIVANTTFSGNCYREVGAGILGSTGYNLSDDATCILTGLGDRTNTSAGLGALASNGGQTQTHLPQPGSLAIDRGSCPAGTDQRGLPRPAGLACDVGAVEVQDGEFATATPTSTTTRTSTVTSTVTLTPSATSVSTATQTSTATRTATPTTSPAATVGSTVTAGPKATSALGGHGFSLETNPGGPAIARWRGGTLQTGYQGLRIALPSGEFTFYPGGSAILPATATSYADFTPGDIGCYLTLVLGGTPPGVVQYGNGDAICLFSGVASGAAPLNFKAQMNESPITTLTWTAPAPGGQSGYTLVVIPTDGSGLTFQALSPLATSTTHAAGNQVVCYQLQVSGIAGQTDALCSFPNGSTLTAGSPATTRATFDRLRDGLDRSRAEPLRLR